MNRFTIFLVIIAAAATVAAADERKTIQVEFTEQLDVKRLNGESYMNFVKHLRQRLAVEYSHGVPVLPVRNEQDLRGFDIKLTSGRHETTVRIHHDNLDLRGFQMQRPQRWFEFGRSEQKPPHLIEGSQLLEFDNNYDDLTAVAQQGILDMSFNKNELRQAVQKLARSMDSQDRAKSLIVVTQMICDALRFVDVANYFASNFDNQEEVRLPEWMLNDLDNHWESYSYLVLKSDADPCYKFDPPTINGKQIQSVDELRNFLGIMTRDPDTLKPPCPVTIYRHMKKVYGFKGRPFGLKMVVQA